MGTPNKVPLILGNPQIINTTPNLGAAPRSEPRPCATARRIEPIRRGLALVLRAPAVKESGFIGFIGFIGLMGLGCMGSRVYRVYSRGFIVCRV